jgi:hypothetical protein
MDPQAPLNESQPFIHVSEDWKESMLHRRYGLSGTGL